MPELSSHIRHGLGGKPASIYVYVEDVDLAYRRALEAGGTSLAAPEAKP